MVQGVLGCIGYVSKIFVWSEMCGRNIFSDEFPGIWTYFYWEQKHYQLDHTGHYTRTVVEITSHNKKTFIRNNFHI